MKSILVFSLSLCFLLLATCAVEAKHSGANRRASIYELRNPIFTPTDTPAPATGTPAPATNAPATDTPAPATDTPAPASTVALASTVAATTVPSTVAPATTKAPTTAAPTTKAPSTLPASTVANMTATPTAANMTTPVPTVKNATVAATNAPGTVTAWVNVTVTQANNDFAQVELARQAVLGLIANISGWQSSYLAASGTVAGANNTFLMYFEFAIPQSNGVLWPAVVQTLEAQFANPVSQLFVDIFQAHQLTLVSAIGKYDDQASVDLTSNLAGVTTTGHGTVSGATSNVASVFVAAFVSVLALLFI